VGGGHFGEAFAAHLFQAPLMVASSSDLHSGAPDAIASIGASSAMRAVSSGTRQRTGQCDHIGDGDNLPDRLRVTELRANCT
jgi:hypothetical protein